MKKILNLFILSIITVLCFAQNISELTFDQYYNYLSKPLYVKSKFYSISDVNGKVVKESSYTNSYNWIDWNNRVVKHIEYNNFNHPCNYGELYFNSDGVLQKYVLKNIYSDVTQLYEYSSNYSSFTIFDINGSKKEKHIYGEYVKENGSFVYYEYEYENGEISSVYKITGPNLSGDVRKFSINATEDNPLYKYKYEENELEKIVTIFGNDLDYYEITYTKDSEPVRSHTILDKNKNPIYSESTSQWGEKYKNTYEFDNYGNPKTNITYIVNDEFGIEYLEPSYCIDYEYFYSPNKEIIEPTVPKTFYSYFEEDKSDTSEPEIPSLRNDIDNVSGLWEKAYYIDSFGDYTTSTYLRLKEKIIGTFSNSATTNSRLRVQFLVDSPREMAIKLYEYGDQEVKTYSSNPSPYYIYVKDENGNTHMFKGKNTSDRIVIEESDCLSLHELMMVNNSLKFYLTYETLNSYNFTLTIDQSYREAFSK